MCGGAHLRGGAHHHLEEVFLVRGRLLQRQGQRQGKFRGKQEAKAKQRIRIKTKQARGRKAHQGKGHLTSQGLWESLRGTPRHQRVVAIVPGSLVYVSCVVHFSLRPSIYICSKLVFPMGGGFQGHVDQKSMCQIYACLEV
jgi:hypothetical protein